MVGQKHKVLYVVIFPHKDLLPKGEEERGKKSLFYRKNCFLNVFISLSSNILSQDINNFYQMEKELSHISLWRNKAQYVTLLSEELKNYYVFFNVDKFSNGLPEYIHFPISRIAFPKLFIKRIKHIISVHSSGTW